MSQKRVSPRSNRNREAPSPPALHTDAEPEINIVNLNHKEFAVLNVLRDIDEGQLDIRIRDSDIVQVVRRQRVPLPPWSASGES